MAIKAVAFTIERLQRYRKTAEAMAEGIRACGDEAVVTELQGPKPAADVGLAWGWGFHKVYDSYPKFLYVDLGYWGRGEYFRVTVGGWSPDKYVKAGFADDRLKALGFQVKPWRDTKGPIIIAGSSRKACRDHGRSYMEWETSAAKKLLSMGLEVVYRPKPSDKEARPIPGTIWDKLPLDQSLARASGLVSHHSNAAIDALVDGIPVHCETGAAAAFSVPLEAMANPARLDGREQFLADVAYLQWTQAEMRSGACWAHLKERGLLC